MKRVYQIKVAKGAPTLTITGPTDHVKAFRKLRGESLTHLSPDSSFTGQLSSCGPWTQFYRVGDGAFAIGEEAFEHCMAMYYVITSTNVELLSVVASGRDMRVVNLRGFFDGKPTAGDPYDLGHAGQLFRIRGRPATDVFCLEGTGIPGNEFKHVYEESGFRGLEFEEIWRERS